MSVSVGERERSWLIDKNCVAKSHITVKITTDHNRRNPRTTPFSAKPPT